VIYAAIACAVSYWLADFTVYAGIRMVKDLLDTYNNSDKESSSKAISDFRTDLARPATFYLPDT
jgi:hypothetical protein